MALQCIGDTQDQYQAYGKVYNETPHFRDFISSDSTGEINLSWLYNNNYQRHMVITVVSPCTSEDGQLEGNVECTGISEWICQERWVLDVYYQSK